MKYMNAIISILSGLAVCIPLVYKLITTVTQNVKEKNWAAIMNYTVGYITEAEKMNATGAAKKAWVMGMVEQTAANINYPLDDDAKAKISALIDSMCDMAKTVNVEATAK